MNSNTNDLKPIPRWLRPLLGDTSEMEIADADLAEAAGIIRDGARAYRDSVVIPFELPKVEAAIAKVGILAAAGSDMQRRFPVLLAEVSEHGASYTAAGVADLVEGPFEDDDGGVFAVWEWIPEGSAAGYEGLIAAVMSQDTGEECGRGVLRKAGGGWKITVDQGPMKLLSGVTGSRHPILLLA